MELVISYMIFIKYRTGRCRYFYTPTVYYQISTSYILGVHIEHMVTSHFQFQSRKITSVKKKSLIWLQEEFC